MTDIVDRLRACMSDSLEWEAADEIERLRAALRDLISADDAMLAFLLAVTSQELGEPEWDRQHKERSQQKRSATLAALALIEGGKP